MKDVLIVGATGFIGRNLIEMWCPGTSDRVTAAGLPGEDMSWAIRFGASTTCELCVGSGGDHKRELSGRDVVVYLVGGLNPGLSNRDVPSELAGITAFASFLDECVDAGVGEVLYMSSGGAVYGAGNPPFSERDFTEPITTYGIEKLTCEKLLSLYHSQFGLGYRVIRLSNPYGPHQNSVAGQGVISAFVANALAGEDLVVWGDGSVVRDFIWIGDAVKGIVEISSCDVLANGVTNLGSGVGTTIGEVAELVAGLCGKHSKVVYLPGRGVDVPSNWLDISRFHSCCGKFPFTPLEEGVERTIEWQRRRIES